MKNLQKGRSMIEMLGVLAIVGVLSIGGLAGYTMAMNRWRANTLTDYVTRCLVVSQTRGVDGRPAAGAACEDVLNEGLPGFVDSVEIQNYAPDTDETRILVTGVSDTVIPVLTDKMGDRVNGVAVKRLADCGTYTAASETFAATFKSLTAATSGNSVCFSFMNAS